jgi:hypothetical protein
VSVPVRRFPQLNLPDHFVGAQGLAPLQDGNFFDRNHLTTPINERQPKLPAHLLTKNELMIQIQGQSPRKISGIGAGLR